MTDFKTIEKDYLTIDPLVKDKLLPFYDRHKGYFDNAPPNDNDELRKYLWMLTEIGVTYSFAKDHKTALPILDKVITLYEKYADRLDINLKEEREYNSAIWNKGYSFFELKQYFKARPFLKRMKDDNTHQLDDKYATLLKICDWKIKNRIAIGLGLVGLLILVTKYSVKWFSPDNYSDILAHSGFLGGLLLIAFGLIYKTKIKVHAD